MTSNAAPPSSGLLGHLPAFQRDPLGFLTNCADEERGYGDVVTLRMLHKRVYLLLNPEDIERVLVIDHRQFSKPSWLRTRAVRTLLGDGLVTSEDDQWRSQRQECMPAFQHSRMTRYGEGISTLAVRATDGWTPGGTIDLHHEITRLTLQIVGQLLLGVQQTDWTDEAGEAMNVLMARFTSGPGIFGMAPWPAGPEERKAAAKLDRVVDRIIRLNAESRRDSGGEGDEDLLQLCNKHGGSGDKRNQSAALREQVKTFLTAGHESSALALSWAILLLARNPEAASSLRQELDSALGGRPPVPSDLTRLPYARAVVQEALRLYPPLWMTGRETRSAYQIGGHNVPPGALIMTSQWVVHRLSKYFPCPKEFQPQRWMDIQTAALPRCAFFPFGAGPRVCIGQNFAMMEATLILATISQRFRLEIDADLDITPYVSMTLRPPAGIRARCVVLKAQNSS